MTTCLYMNWIPLTGCLTGTVRCVVLWMQYNHGQGMMFVFAYAIQCGLWPVWIPIIVQVGSFSWIMFSLHGLVNISPKSRPADLVPKRKSITQSHLGCTFIWISQ